MTILIVDDNATCLALLREQLESGDYTVLEAMNGLEALEAVKSKSIDLVISDILMPRMDGYRLCHLLRHDDRSKDIPFIFYTGTYTSPSDETFALQLGADKFMEKTGSTESILAAVREVLERPRLKRGPVMDVGEQEVLHEYTERLVTKLKEKNDELTQWAAEIKKLSGAVEQTADSVVITDKEGMIRFVNPAFERATGFTREEVLGKTPRILRSGKHEQSFYESLWQTILSGETFRATFINKKKNGELYYEEQSITPIVDEAGAIAYFVSTGRDITEQKKGEEALRESENRYRMLFDGNPLPLWVFEIHTLRFLAVNDAAVKHYGYSRDEFLSMAITQIRPAEDVARVVEDVAKTREGSITHGFWKHLKKDGTVIDVEISAHDFTFSGKKARLVLANDVTEQKRAEQALVESEERYRQLTDTIKEVFWMTNVPKNEMIYISKGYEDLWGRTRESLYQNPLSWVESIHPDDRERILNDSLSKQTAGTYDEEYRIVQPEGSIRWIHDKAFPIQNEKGSVYRIVGVAEDITERKEVEARLDAERRLLRTIIEAIPDEVTVKDTERRFVDANAGAVRALKRTTRGEVLGKKDEDLIPESFAREAAREEEEIFRTGEPLINKDPLPAMDPRTGRIRRAILTSKLPLRDPSGSITGLVTVNRDVTNLMRSSEQVTQFSNLGQRLNSAAAAEDAARIIAETADSLMGWDACTIDLYSKPDDLVSSILNVDTLHGRRIDIPPLRRQGPPSDRMRRVLEKGAELILRGEEEGLSDNAVPFGDATRPSKSMMFVPIHSGEKLIGILSIQSYSVGAYNAEDLKTLESLAAYCGGALERIGNTQALLHSEERYRGLIDSAQDIILTVSLQGIITSLNPAFEKLTGWTWSEWIGKSLTDFFAPEDTVRAQRYLRQTLETGKTFSGEFRIQKKTGDFLVAEFITAPQIQEGVKVGLLGVARDITEKKNLEGQLRHAQKLESIGTLAGGVAHDFNNILGIILGYASILQRDSVTAETVEQVVKPITDAVQRGAGLVRQLLTFARKTGVITDPVNINTIVFELASMVRATFPKTIEILLETDPDLPILMADQSQLHQTLLNLCVNARDAMPSGGTITVRTGCIDGSSVRRRFPDAREEQYVVIVVGDTGSGMDEETRNRIFEPFFTTKELGKGTGLGLSVVYGVIQSLNGFIDVESEVGKGTTFHLYLPVLTIENLPPLQVRSSDETIRGGSETVLLVEDEESMHFLAKSFLEMNGYSVVSAFNGQEAVELFEQRRESIDLVLSDMGLPRLNGLEAVKRMKSLRADLKVILASGFIDPNQQAEIEKAGIKMVIQKPYNPVSILRSIRTMLDES
ncbi:MAG: PAS domain S-box protein [Ignavibacteriales bacterium]|nr:PAS domain S-box protein [Ignavibacteriales bacterium]